MANTIGLPSDIGTMAEILYIYIYLKRTQINYRKEGMIFNGAVCQKKFGKSKL